MMERRFSIALSLTPREATQHHIDYLKLAFQAGESILFGQLFMLTKPYAIIAFIMSTEILSEDQREMALNALKWSGLQTWKPADVLFWLSCVYPENALEPLPAVREVFRVNDVDGITLKALDKTDLFQMGIKTARMRIFLCQKVKDILGQ